jgi:hypothetical protein
VDHRRSLPEQHRTDRPGRASGRTWTSWYRWTTLVLPDQPCSLAVVTVAERANTTSPGLIPPDNQTKLDSCSSGSSSSTLTSDCLHRSRWRRRHQHRARQAHYQRRSNQE